MKWLMPVAAFMLACAPLPASAQNERPPFEYASAETLPLLAQDQLAQVVILNNTPADLTLTITLSALLPSAGKAPAVPSPFDLLGDSARTLPAAGQASAQIQIVGAAALQPGEYSAYLIASSTQPAHVARRLITLQVKAPPTPKGRLSASVDAWTIKLTQGTPRVSLQPLAFALSNEWTNASLPVQMTGVVSLPIGVVGTLAGSNEGAVEVRALELITHPLGWLSMPLQINPQLTPGTYAGSIKLGSDSTAKLSLLVAHHWVYPLLVVLLVVSVISAFISRFTNVLNKVWQLRERLEEAYRGLFSAGGAGYAAYRLKDLDGAREADIRKLRALESYTKLDASTDEYKSTAARITALEDASKAWQALPAALALLKKQVDALTLKLPSPPAPDTESPPRFMRDTLPWLTGGELTLDGWTKRAAELKCAQAVLAHWLASHADVAKAWARITANPPAPSATTDTRTKWEADQRSAISLSMMLWEETAAALSPDKFIPQLNDLKKAASAWSTQREVAKDLSPIPTLTTLSGTEEAQGCMPAILTWLLRQSARPAASTPTLGERIRARVKAILVAITPAAWRLRRRLGATATLLVAAFVAGAAALSQVYFGKPFGTLVDYVNLIAWAAGVNALVGGVLTALDRVLLRKEA